MILAGISFGFLLDPSVSSSSSAYLVQKDFPPANSSPPTLSSVMAPLQLVCALLLVTVSAVVRAMPLLPSRAEGGASALSLDEISAFKPYTHYASAAYCKPNTTHSWTCGTHCDANPSFVPIASGGDGTLAEFCKSESSQSRTLR